MAFKLRSSNHNFPTRTSRQLYSNFVPARAESSSSGGGDFSDTMANSDGASNDGRTQNTHAPAVQMPAEYALQHDFIQLVHVVDVMQSQFAALAARMDEQEQHLTAQHDTVIVQDVPTATQKRFAEVYSQAADEQYRLDDHRISTTARVQDTSSCRHEHKGMPSSSRIAPDTQEDTASHAAAVWMPRAVRELEPLNMSIDIESLERLSQDTINLNLGGTEWSPGFYFVQHPNSDKAINNCKGYWLLEQGTEPFAPTSPGMHGAKLTAFYRDLTDEQDVPTEDTYDNIPVFVKLIDEDDYTYMGHYEQSRVSDRLDYDTMQHVPISVLKYWSEQLADPERPEWVTAALTEHFWPKPRYTGPMPTDAATETSDTADTAVFPLEPRVLRGFHEYADELRQWERKSHRQVSMLTPAKLRASFWHADAELEPGLRLNWEYMQCLRWDEDFYTRMVQYKHYFNPHGRERSKSKKKSKREDSAKATVVSDHMRHKEAYVPITEVHQSGHDRSRSHEDVHPSTHLNESSHSLPAPQMPRGPDYVPPHLRGAVKPT